MSTRLNSAPQFFLSRDQESSQNPIGRPEILSLSRAPTSSGLKRSGVRSLRLISMRRVYSIPAIKVRGIHRGRLDGRAFVLRMNAKLL